MGELIRFPVDRTRETARQPLGTSARRLVKRLREASARREDAFDRAITFLREQERIARRRSRQQQRRHEREED